MIKIVTDEKILRRKSKKITEDDNVEEIVNKLKEATKTAWTNGCGLAAIQIGIEKRIAWLELEDEEEILINPEIIEESYHIINKEGCLSIPDNWVMVKRPNYIKYKSDGKIKEAACFKAHVISHEIDHMNGILNIDKNFFKDKIGRNDLCPCNSGKKYKKCCMN